MEWLNKLPEFYTPGFMILAGFAGLGFLKVLRWSLSRADLRDAERGWLDAAMERFEARIRVSWVLILFGFVWALQLLVQDAWAR